MSGSMADHECKCVLCSKSLLHANERDRLVVRIDTDTLTFLSDELQQLGGVKSNISAIARRELCRSCTTKIKCAVHWIQDLNLSEERHTEHTSHPHTSFNKNITEKTVVANCNAHWHLALLPKTTILTRA